MTFKKIKFIYILFLAILIIPEVQVAGENKYQLKDLLELTKEHNLVLKIADIDQNISRQEYKISRALPNPEIEYSRGQGRVEEAGIIHKPKIWEAGVKLSIPNPLYRYFFLKSERKLIKEADIKREITQREIERGLKHHYYNLQYHNKIKGFFKEKLNILTRISEITKAKVSIGESKEIDYLRSSVEIQKSKTELFRIEKHISNNKNQLNEYLNYTLPEDFEITEDFTYSSIQDIENKIDQKVRKSPLIQLKSNEMVRMSHHLKARKHSLIESIELFGSKGKEMDGDIWQVGIGVSIPILNTKSSEIKKAKLEKEKAKKEFEHSWKHLLANVKGKVSEIRILEKEIATFQGAILKEGRENLELSKQLFQEGEVPLVVFLDSQNSFFELMSRYYEAITEWNILKTEIEELLGEEL